MSCMPPSVRSSCSSSLQLGRRFLLRQRSKLAAMRDCALKLLQVAQPGADRDEVGQRAAEPAPVDVELPGARRFALDDFLRLLLGADEEDPAAARGRRRPRNRGLRRAA